MITDAERERLVNMRDACQAAIDGRPWEVQNTVGEWRVPESDSGLPMTYWRARAKPWSLPPPPEGRQWHRQDFTAEMLPPVTDGGLPWRPLMAGEVMTDKDFVRYDTNPYYWQEVLGSIGETPESSGGRFCRTRRALPSAPVVRPWRFEDFPKAANCWLRLSDRQNPSAALESQVVAISERGINHYSGDFMKFMPWADKRWLELEYSTTRADGSWHPCQTPA